MRRAVCLFMVLMLVMSMACTAFAATPSSGNEPGTGGDCIDGGDHDWEDGVCKKCGKECEHDHYKNGKCTECGKECEHNFVDGKCTICGMKEKSGESPKTGDMMIVSYTAAMVSSAAALAFVVRKKNA